MTTKVALFLTLKNEAAARQLGVRRLRQAPEDGQRFVVTVDGRPVRARITRCTPGAEQALGVFVPEVFADEL